MMTTFSQLPTELVSMIASMLENQDLRHLRTVSRSISLCAFDHFAKRHFRKKGFMITEDSLGVLEKIAHHTELAVYVEHIWFNPDCYTFVNESLVGTNLDHAVEDDRLKLQRQAFHCIVNDHVSLLQSQRLSSLLSDSFLRLENLKVLGMRRGRKHRPWGYSRLRTSIGLDPRVLGRDFELDGPISETTMLFAALISALTSGKVKLRRLYTDAIQIDDLAMDYLQLNKGTEALEQVECLEANFTRSSFSRRQNDLALASAGRNVLPLLASMPAITDISFTIFADSRQNHIFPPIEGLLDSWRGTYPFVLMQKMSKEVHFRNLRRVKIEKLCTSCECLLEWLQSSSHYLSSLKLKDINFVSAEHQDMHWATFFTFLSSCDKLEYLLLSHLRQDGQQVRFVEHIPTNSSLARRIGNVTWLEHEWLSIEISGRDKVRSDVPRLIREHWCTPGHFTATEVGDMWYTDTSDEADYTEDEDMTA